jgi:hypothetical protein
MAAVHWLVRRLVFALALLALPVLAVVAVIGALLGEFRLPAGCLRCSRRSRSSSPPE